MGETRHCYRPSRHGANRYSSHDITRESFADPARVRSILEPLDRSRLVDLITDLVSEQPSVFDHLRSLLRSDPTQRRLFVRGLSRDCTNQDLMAVFSVYGVCTEAVVMKEKGTKCCKGFGFVTFADADAANAAIQNSEKLIADRMATVSLAALGNRNKSPAVPIAATYSSAHSTAPTGCYSQHPSNNSHKRYRERSPPSYHENYKLHPPSHPQIPSKNSQYYSEQSYYEMPKADPSIYWKPENDYLDHTSTYPYQKRY